MCFLRNLLLLFALVALAVGIPLEYQNSHENLWNESPEKFVVETDILRSRREIPDPEREVKSATPDPYEEHDEYLKYKYDCEYGRDKRHIDGDHTSEEKSAETKPCHHQHVHEGQHEGQHDGHHSSEDTKKSETAARRRRHVEGDNTSEEKSSEDKTKEKKDNSSEETKKIDAVARRRRNVATEKKSTESKPCHHIHEHEGHHETADGHHSSVEMKNLESASRDGFNDVTRRRHHVHDNKKSEEKFTESKLGKHYHEHEREGHQGSKDAKWHHKKDIGTTAKHSEVHVLKNLNRKRRELNPRISLNEIQDTKDENEATKDLTVTKDSLEDYAQGCEIMATNTQEDPYEANETTYKDDLLKLNDTEEKQPKTAVKITDKQNKNVVAENLDKVAKETVKRKIQQGYEISDELVSVINEKSESAEVDVEILTSSEEERIVSLLTDIQQEFEKVHLYKYPATRDISITSEEERYQNKFETINEMSNEIERKRRSAEDSKESDSKSSEEDKAKAKANENEVKGDTKGESKGEEHATDAKADESTTPTAAQ